MIFIYDVVYRGEQEYSELKSFKSVWLIVWILIKHQ